ncbi:MAG TPA: CpaF family protein [Bacilli bacterium]
MDEVYGKLRDQLRERLKHADDLPDERLREWIEEAVLSQSAANYIPYEQKRQLTERLFNSFRGLDVLQALVDDKTVTEIMVNNFDEIFYEKAGEIHKYPAAFESREKLEDIIQLIVGKVNRAVNEASPIVDARLQDGSRVHVVLPPIALKGPTLTIRKFPERPLTLAELQAKGTLSEETGQVLELLVRAGYNIFISGGTGSGKTTLLNALAECIPQGERIITIEDSAELNITAVPNLVKMETRNANSEGKGNVTIRELIRASLRMRPNRIIVGEVRGAEALDMLQAMNTGHDGSISTGHANSVEDMLSRIETMVYSGANLPVEVIRRQISSAVEIMVHLSRLRDRSRKVMEICELVRFANGEIELNPLYRFQEQGETEDGAVIGQLAATGNRLQRRLKLVMGGFADHDLPLPLRAKGGDA